MNNIKLLKAQYKLALGVTDKRLQPGIENYVAAQAETIRKLKAALTFCEHELLLSNMENGESRKEARALLAELEAE